MNETTGKIDRIGEKLTEALWECLDNLNTDNLCIVLATAYHLLDEQNYEDQTV